MSPDAVLSPHAWPLLLPLHYLMFPGCGGYSRGYLIPQLHHSGQQRCWSRTHGLIHSSHSAGPCPRHHLPLGARHRTHHAHHGRGKGARGLQAALWILLRYHVWLRKILSLWIMQRSSHPIRYHCIRLISIALPHTAQRHIIAFSSDEVMSLISWHATLLSCVVRAILHLDMVRELGGPILRHSTPCLPFLSSNLLPFHLIPGASAGRPLPPPPPPAAHSNNSS